MQYKKGLFDRQVKVIQVFKKVHLYGKENRSFDSRKSIVQWKDICSTNGHVSSGQLWLPPYLITQPNFLQSAIIFLIDEEWISPYKVDIEKSIFHPFSKKYKLYCFSINEQLEIRFHYDSFDIGIPEREDFDLGALKKNVPLEIKINGKYDATMSRGMERLFKEQHFIFEYLGDFTEYWEIKEPVEPHLKSLNKERKSINLLKPLW